MEGVQEGTVIEWLREMGFQAGDASLSRAAVSKMLKGSSRQIWARIVETWKSPRPLHEEAEVTGPAKLQVKATRAEKASLEAAIEAQRASNRQLEELVAAQQVMGSRLCARHKVLHDDRGKTVHLKT